MGLERDGRESARPPDDEEIEILEVVGLDEDAPPGSGDDDVELTFDDADPASQDWPDTPVAERERSKLESRERLLRLQADFENLRKRVERERDEHLRYSNAALIERLLPVLDNFDRALAVAKRGEDGLHQGVEMIRRQFVEALSREGVRPIPSMGEAFDPQLHEAVATERATGQPPNTILEELRRGYFLHDRVLRHALVRVAIDVEESIGSADDDWEDLNHG